MRATRSLVIILYTVLHRPMGRKLLRDFGLLHFGMSVIKVWLRYSGILPVLKIYLTSVLTEGPTVDQKR